jgi:metal-responsive CopG/Arc/MetJ family transcriptional regulator
MPRPKKAKASQARPVTVSLKPPVLKQLDAIMLEDGEDNRSAIVARLVVDEAARRARRSARRP